MQNSQLSRRAFAISLAALPVGLAVAVQDTVVAADGLSLSSGAIRQEAMFDANPQRVYEALTNTKAFDTITRLSDGAALLAAAGAKPTAISSEVGGAFTLFGGYVSGRHLEMLPNLRLIQAWRAGSWKPGEFSIASFSLAAEGAKTRLSFAHRGFPDGAGVSLANGWHSHYWEPLRKFLAQT